MVISKDHRARVPTLTLCVLLLIAMATIHSLSEAAPPEMRVSLSTVRQPDGNEGGVFRVDASAVGIPLDQLAGAEVTAQVWDPDGRLVGEFECHAVTDRPGLYRSDPFAPPLDTALGEWKVRVKVSQGDTDVLSWETLAMVGVDQSAPPSGNTTDVGSQDEEVARAPNEADSSTASGSPGNALMVFFRAIAERIREISMPFGSMRIPGTTLQLTSGPFLFGLLVSISTMIAFVGVWRIRRPLDAVQERVKEYGFDGDLQVGDDIDGYRGEQRMLSKLNRRLTRLTLGARLSDALIQADLPLTATEFALLMLGAACLGLLVGTWRAGITLGIVIGVLFMYLPIMYLGSARKRRQRAFTEQLPDMLTLMVGALRAGYGLTQALQTLVDQLPPPASKELARVSRSIGFGISIQEALNDMADRITTDDVRLVVTAINVQYEMGGNLAETLEIAAETIRDRLFMQRQIRAMTSEERLSAYFVGALPLLLGFALYALNPKYMAQMFAPEAPGWVRLMPVVALLMQGAGFMVMSKITDIEV